MFKFPTPDRVTRYVSTSQNPAGPGPPLARKVQVQEEGQLRGPGLRERQLCCPLVGIACAVGWGLLPRATSFISLQLFFCILLGSLSAPPPSSVTPVGPSLFPTTTSTWTWKLRTKSPELGVDFTKTWIKFLYLCASLSPLVEGKIL